MQQRGFTLVELVMVIILLGVLSAAATSLFARTGSFSALAARDRFIAMGLLAQQQALANSGTSTFRTLRVEQQSNAWLLSLQVGGSDVTADRVDRGGLTLSLNGSILTDGQVVAVNFQQDGSTGANRAWLFSGDNSHSACQTSTGFMHPGSCQP
jgi:prepilin-type N-terminal cleavage/methylation domain-containing protein